HTSRLQKSEKCNPCVRYEMSPMSRAAHVRNCSHSTADVQIALRYQCLCDRVHSQSGMYLLVTPKGAGYRRLDYRFAGNAGHLPLVSIRACLSQTLDLDARMLEVCSQETLIPALRTRQRSASPGLPQRIHLRS